MTENQFIREGNEAVYWDSRKTLADAYQEFGHLAHLDEATYAALVNAAADVEPVRLDPSSAKHYVIVKGGWPECSCGMNGAMPHASFLWLTEHIANVYRATS